MVYLSVVEKNKQMYDCSGWVKVRHSLCSRRRLWYMRLLGSSLTLHKSIDKPVVWEFSVTACKVSHALFSRSFSLTLSEGGTLRVSCDSKREASMWKQALTKASNLIFEDAFQVLEPVQDANGWNLFKAVDKSDESQVLVRRIAKDAKECVSLADTHAHSRQLYSIRNLRHYNLMGATKVFNDVGYAYIVSKVESRTRFTDVVNDSGGTLPEAMVRIFAVQLVQALQFMHMKGYAHRNVALENMWVDDSDPSDPRVVLSSFEHVAFVDDDEDLRMRGQVGNERYRAPEMLEERTYSAAVDLFSLGVCIYRMLSGSYPFGGRHVHESTRVEEIERGPKFEEAVWNKVSAEAKEFVKSLLDPCAVKRVTAKRAEDDAWFRIDVPSCVDDCVEHNVVKNVGVLERVPEADKQFMERIPGCKTVWCKVERIRGLAELDEGILTSTVGRVSSPLSEESPL